MQRLLIPLLFCADAPYFQHMSATIASLLRSNSAHDFRIFVCSERRNSRAEEKLSAIASRFGNASFTFLEFELAQHRDLRVDRYLTLSAYMRLFLTEFLDPSVEKVLYLDCDLIVSGDIGELWRTDLAGAFLAAVPEPYMVTSHWGFGPEDTYFNSGVLLIDVARWRAADVLPAFLQFAQEHASELNCHDQDVLNHVFRDKVRILDYRWNFQSRFADFPPEVFEMSASAFREVRRLPSIVHFTTQYKPWFYRYEPHYKTLYNQALALTPWSHYRPPDRTPQSILLKFLTMKYPKSHLKWCVPRVGNFLVSRRRSQLE
jgi:lipopolysaccharide biosynthesis glycosyltransferase